MTIIEKHFEEKLSDKEIGEFIANFIDLKGYANMDVIYDEKNEGKINGFHTNDGFTKGKIENITE